MHFCAAADGSEKRWLILERPRERGHFFTEALPLFPMLHGTHELNRMIR